jgi:hypothetical protein
LNIFWIAPVLPGFNLRIDLCPFPLGHLVKNSLRGSRAVCKATLIGKVNNGEIQHLLDFLLYFRSVSLPKNVEDIDFDGCFDVISFGNGTPGITNPIGEYLVS